MSNEIKETVGLTSVETYRITLSTEGMKKWIEREGKIVVYLDMHKHLDRLLDEILGEIQPEHGN